MKKFLITIFCLLVGCGYQPIYIGSTNQDLLFKDIKLIGNKTINKKIVSSLKIKKDTSINNSKEIIITSDKLITEIAKNSKGQTETYRTTINLNITIKDKENILKNKNFNENFSYNNIDNKFDLRVYQDDVEINLTKKIIEELIIYLNL